MKISELCPVFVEDIKLPLEEGVLYISKVYGVAIHLCACGCGKQAVTPIGITRDDWTLMESSEGVTLRPSIGNFIGERPYHAHYYITNNKIQWLS